jgi:2-dehydropantoate 2-reductase
MGRGELVIGGRAGIEADARAAEATARTFERAGVRLDAEGLLARVMKVGESMPGQISSTAQDIGLGKPTEIDALNGHVVRRGAALGVPTPVNRTLYALVKLLEIAKWTPRHAAPRGGRVLRTLSPPRAAPCIRPTSRRA